MTQRHNGTNVAVKDTKDTKDECGAIVVNRYKRGNGSHSHWKEERKVVY